MVSAATAPEAHSPETIGRWREADYDCENPGEADSQTVRTVHIRLGVSIPATRPSQPVRDRSESKCRTAWKHSMRASGLPTGAIIKNHVFPILCGGVTRP